MMAERLNALPYKLDNISKNQALPYETDIMSLFQFMIGNSDYSIMKRHNVKLLKLKDLNMPNPIPVPYDFDYTGIVNAPYAEPEEHHGIDKITDRQYLGPCRTKDEYQKAIEVFIQRKEDIYATVNAFAYADSKTKKYVLNYLNEFYSLIEKSWFIEHELESTCYKKAKDN
jgi:hypothetical protein